MNRASTSDPVYLAYPKYNTTTKKEPKKGKSLAKFEFAVFSIVRHANKQVGPISLMGITITCFLYSRYRVTAFLMCVRSPPSSLLFLLDENGHILQDPLLLRVSGRHGEVLDPFFPRLVKVYGDDYAARSMVLRGEDG